MNMRPVFIALRVLVYSSLAVLCLLFVLAWAIKNGVVVLPPSHDDGRPATTIPPSLR